VVIDTHFQADPGAIVRTTFFTFSTTPGLPSFVWDPEFGIVPHGYRIDQQVAKTSDAQSSYSSSEETMETSKQASQSHTQAGDKDMGAASSITASLLLIAFALFAML